MASTYTRPALLFGAGAVAGGLTAVAVLKWKHASAQEPAVAQSAPTAPGRTEARPAVPISPKPAKPETSPNVPNGRTKDIMKFGFPGPVSDILYRQAYVGSYNRSLRNPNWVAEHLTAESVGNDGPDDGSDANKPERSHSTFKEDVAIPRLFRAKLKDYVRSGYDRGHLAPAADVRESQEAMDETFLLTNISPQVGKGFNRNYWFYLENFTRSLTKHFDDVHVITGPLYLPKQEADGKFYVKYEVIGDPPNTAVPTHFYKVILGVKGKEYALQAFVLPNAAINDEPLEKFTMPLDAVEHASGLVFYPDLNRLAYKPLCNVVKCEVLQHFQENVKENAKKANWW